MSTTEAVEKTMRSVFVGNIPYEVTEERLKEIFGEVGTVLSFKLVFDRESGKPKGYGFCEYSNQETALSAMRNLNNFEIGGRSLRVDNACTEKSRLEMQSLMQISQGENLFGEFVSPDKAPEAIREVVSSLPPEEMYEILNEMKDSIRNNPEETRRMLLENGQLSYALLQITVAMGIIDRITASQMLYPENNEAALSLEIHPDNLMPGMRKANMIPPKLDLSWRQTPQNEEVIGPQRDMWNRGEQFDNQPLLPIGRQESWNDKPKRVSTNQLQAPPVQDMDMRSVPLGMNQQSMFGDQDFRNPMVPMQPPPGFPSNMVMPNMSRPPPSATQNFHGSRQHSMNVPPPNMQPAPTMQPPPTIGPSRMMPHQPSNNQPSKQMAQMQAAMLPPSAPQQAKQIAQTLAGTDNEKAALIMQVMQLTDEQISKLPAEQRQSILILKEQIAKSTKH